MNSLFDQVKAIPRGASVILEWLGDGARVVDKDTAQQRANTCLKCPNNVQGFAFAKPVALAIAQHLEVKNHLKLRVDGEKSLGSCSACTCVIRLLIWQPQDKVAAELTDEEKTKLPDFCWKTK